MINSASIDALKRAQWTPHFNRPLYDSYSFSLIPQTISQLLTGTSDLTLPVDTVGGKWELFDCVVLFLIDGFGWEFFEGFAHQYPFLNRFSNEGVASKISSQFPSTTAAHVTTINTDLEVGLSGIYEWFYHEPKVGEMIAPLLFSYAGDHVVSTLVKKGYTAHQLFPFETFYQQLKKKGVKSIVMQQESIAHSPYSRAMLAGAENIPYVHFTDAMDQLKTICETPKREPTYIFVYFGEIDAMGHRHGITSPKFADAVEFCWNTIENRFWQPLSPKKKTAVLVTADHGMVPVDPKKTIYLNQLFPEIKEMIQPSVTGKALIPAGSCRDFFLHCKEERLEEVQCVLQEKLSGIADVVKVDELLKNHFFGREKPSKRLKDRVGNLVILPYLGESVWWFEKHRFEQHFFAAHGGLTPPEIESIFLYQTRS